MSPLFNERDNLVRLLAILEEEVLEKDQELSNEEVYQLLYEDRSFNEASLKTSMAQLLKLLRDFLAYRRFHGSELVQQQMLLETLNELGENKYFKSYWNGAKRTLEKTPLNASDYFHEKMRLEEAWGEYNRRLPQRDPNLLMHKAIENLGNSFLLRMLRYRIRLISMQASFSSQLRYSLMNWSLDYLQNHVGQMAITVQVYYQLHTALIHPEVPGHYEQAVELLAKSVPELSELETEELYTVAMNFAVQRVNEGKLDYLERVFSLYLAMLEHKVIVVRGCISPFHFKNIVVAAMRLHKAGWAEQFIEQWKGRIDRDYAGNALNFNRGVVCYFQKDYAQAERFLHTVLDDYKDVFYGLNARGYLLQIHFETGNMLGLESLAHSFRMFLSRNRELSDRKIRLYRNFINHLNKLINIAPQRADKLEKLYREIAEKDERGMGSEWLLEKIRGMLGEERYHKMQTPQAADPETVPGPDTL